MRCGYTLSVCLRQICNYQRLQRNHNTALQWRLTGISFYQQSIKCSWLMALQSVCSMCDKLAFITCIHPRKHLSTHSHSRFKIQVTPLPFITHWVLASGTNWKYFVFCETDWNYKSEICLLFCSLSLWQNNKLNLTDAKCQERGERTGWHPNTFFFLNIMNHMKKMTSSCNQEC